MANMFPHTCPARWERPVVVNWCKLIYAVAYSNTCVPVPQFEMNFRFLELVYLGKYAAFLRFMHWRVGKWEQRRSWQLEFQTDRKKGRTGREREGRGSCSRNAAGECRRRRLQFVLILAASCGGCRCRQGTQLGKVIKGGTPRDRDAALMIIEASLC